MMNLSCQSKRGSGLVFGNTCILYFHNVDCVATLESKLMCCNVEGLHIKWEKSEEDKTKRDALFL